MLFSKPVWTSKGVFEGWQVSVYDSNTDEQVHTVESAVFLDWADAWEVGCEVINGTDPNSPVSGDSLDLRDDVCDSHSCDSSVLDSIAFA